MLILAVGHSEVVRPLRPEKEEKVNRGKMGCSFLTFLPLVQHFFHIKSSASPPISHTAREKKTLGPHLKGKKLQLT